MLTSDSRPLDVISHEGAGTLIGAFRCPVTHPRFLDSGPIENDIFVFPRSSVRIRHSGGPAFVADPTLVTLYNRGQIYDRSAISADGDRSDWFSVPRAVAMEAVVANGLEPSARGPFPLPFVPIPNRTYLEQRRLFRQARRTHPYPVPAPVIDEGIYVLLDAVVAAAAARPRGPARTPEATDDIAEEIRSFLSSRFEEEWPLSRLAAHFGVSQFRLCRAFRKATGSTIHQYLLTVRLRVSLERLEPPRADLSAVAYDLGFSGHSHFSHTFRRAFGESPSRCRSEVSQPARGHKGPAKGGRPESDREP